MPLAIGGSVDGVHCKGRNAHQVHVEIAPNGGSQQGDLAILGKRESERNGGCGKRQTQKNKKKESTKKVEEEANGDGKKRKKKTNKRGSNGEEKERV